MEYIIRELRTSEVKELDTFLYEAIFIPEGVEAPPKDIIFQPALQVYVADFGKRKGDKCLVAETDAKIIGAVWVRIMNDYGHVDDETPSIIISVKAPYRGQGTGTALLSELISRLKTKGYARVSLSCQKANRALRLYIRSGFSVVQDKGDEYIMVKEL
ncbi:MAG: GNAT family N-acetyltransferase [Spirochaetales bacterium]|nr:GNAT family N-acetyltransferase [Spirochaetales bacterium]